MTRPRRPGSTRSCKAWRGVLVAAYKERLGKSDIDAVMAEHQFGPTTRAEELDVATILALCETLRKRASVEA